MRMRWLLKKINYLEVHHSLNNLKSVLTTGCTTKRKPSHMNSHVNILYIKLKREEFTWDFLLALNGM